jgi:hypothetical protein
MAKASIEGNELVLRLPWNSVGSFPRSKGKPATATKAAEPGKNFLVCTTSGFKPTTLTLPNGKEIPIQVSVNAFTPPEYANANNG